jgi:outer membrane protein assembly factor BamD
MKITINFILIISMGFMFFSGCSNDIEEYNKPAVYWYGKIIKSVSSGNLEKADDYYSSLQSEHISSPLLPEATMILAIAHMHYEEYLLSEHFLDEYVRRYATANEKEEAEFLKIKAKYMALPNPRRDQALIKETIEVALKFKQNYPNSMYYAIVDTMLTRLYLAEAALNETIASLYDRIDKPKGALYYRSIKPQPWIKWDGIDRANTPWYREWFEGDGTASWYGFMIPDTQSVVSRNSIRSTDGVKKDTKTVEKLQKIDKISTQIQKDEILKAKELFDGGAITQEEFEKLKNEILER